MSYCPPSQEKILECIRDSLPQPEDRMTAARKEAILKAIQHDIITFESALSIYRMSEEELLGWAKNFSLSGRNGLKVTWTERRPRFKIAA